MHLLETTYTRDEMMIVAASRLLQGQDVCFVGIGLPSAAANLARRLHAPAATLVYESGTIGARPSRLPLSIGDDELARTAEALVPVTEMFAYWLQGGRIDVGFLGAAQIDRFANINTTTIGPYEAPRTRLPGAGGAPEIALGARRTIVTVRQSRRTFVERLDFRTSAGFFDGGDERRRRGIATEGPVAVVTDLGILEPDPITKELVLASLHPDTTIDHVRSSTAWALRVADPLATTEAPTADELHVLRELQTGSAGASEPA